MQTSGQETQDLGSKMDSFKGIIMAFTMALVFRAFVIEGFEIPTGSMAPTLLGKHMLFRNAPSGSEWSVGPIDYFPRTSVPLPMQGGQMGNAPTGPFRTDPLTVYDPMSRQDQRGLQVPLRGGDRVFILKYIWPLYTPQRYDVVVFKNPRDPTQNYIKRLVGLGTEEVALIDGDVFSRPLQDANAQKTEGVNTWGQDGWVIDRKDESTMRALWQVVYDSEFVPINAAREGYSTFRSPWIAIGENAKDWQIDGKREYRFTSNKAAELSWDMARRPVLDWYAYNQSPDRPNGFYPVSDIKMSLGIRPETQEQKVAAVWKVRGHEIRAQIDGTNITITMKSAAEGEGQDSRVGQLAKAELDAPLPTGKITNIEFWHADQAITVFVDGKSVVKGVYDWTPAQRVKFALKTTVEEVFTAKENLLTKPDLYVRPGVKMEFSGGPFTISRVTLARDMHYQAVPYPPLNDATPSTLGGGSHTRAGEPAAATHPRQPVILAEGEYFFCGDNSPGSLDARMWEEAYPWAKRLGPKYGVVSREALIGRAFMVYWPGLYWKYGYIPVFDTGRVRQVR